MAKRGVTKGPPGKGYTVAGSFFTLDEARKGCGTLNKYHWRIHKVGGVYQVFYKKKGASK